ncbi:MAG TPA: molybdate ABC transporter substrate-binding protein [Gaiellales bacterium]|nr:molybdate ABC transporter substrate-binding protein [Gaiellales bacterium]
MARRARAAALAVLAAVTLATTGCGGSAAAGAAGKSGSGSLTVLAAASLTGAFRQLGTIFQHRHPGWHVVLEFAASDQLAAQIEQGAPADVFAAASPASPQQLRRAHLLGVTADFATNSLVVAVPAADPAGVHSITDLVTSRAKVVVAAAGVPLGDYTRQVLANLGIPLSRLNVVSEEADAKGVIAKVQLGEADAGFVYVTDAIAAGTAVRQIALPARAQATATYPIGVLAGSSHAREARWWIDLVTGPTGRRVLRRFGFGLPPSP